MDVLLVNNLLDEIRGILTDETASRLRLSEDIFKEKKLVDSIKKTLKEIEVSLTEAVTPGSKLDASKRLSRYKVNLVRAGTIIQELDELTELAEPDGEN